MVIDALLRSSESKRNLLAVLLAHSANLLPEQARLRGAGGALFRAVAAALASVVLAHLNGADRPPSPRHPVRPAATRMGTPVSTWAWSFDAR
ncbi:hypothetical protein [Kutzneria buriramensis]|uniref:Uncharacterized protein n=1 Tax=Kutzneria buriramensis TaxID=1045776 RepID=A0A3E0GXA7_9PSEU|nr:hypothetical protein [Kutzneria buriramensis]REH30705.1 hypothetical protein BCF44_12363 [Kutzneria buriramensis]